MAGECGGPFEVAVHLVEEADVLGHAGFPRLEIRTAEWIANTAPKPEGLATGVIAFLPVRRNPRAGVIRHL